MSLPPSDYSLPAPIPSPQPLGRGRPLARLSAALAITALIASAAWGPVMEVIARLLRPPELNSTRYGYQQVAPFQHDAEQRVWIILIASFLLILALALLAIIFGRRALRFPGSEAPVARLRRWGGVCLVICLLSLVGAVLMEYAPNALATSIGFSYIYTISQFIFIILATTTAMGALASFILNGIVARRAAIRAWLSLVVSALVMLIWFLAVAVLAQFLVAFYLHLVY